MSAPSDAPRDLASSGAKPCHAPSDLASSGAKLCHAPSDLASDGVEPCDAPRDRASDGVESSHAPSDLASDGVESSHAPSDLASLEQKIRDLARPRPIYDAQSVRATHLLRYDWTGWLADGTAFPSLTGDAIRRTALLWEGDGLHLGEFRITADRAQILFSAEPCISPVTFSSRVKGRLQHALREAGVPVGFSRKVAFRSLGENVRSTVEAYLAKQVRKEGFADPRYARRLEAFTTENDGVELSLPAATTSGRYWYNLHLVLVVGGRLRIVDTQALGTIRDTSGAIARKKGYRLKAVSVMPDHVHIALGANPGHAPETVALAFMNNLAYVLGQNRVWEDAYYVGTFSEYGLDTIRRLGKGS